MGKFPLPFVSLKLDHGHCEGWGVLELMGPQITSLEECLHWNHGPATWEPEWRIFRLLPNGACI